MGILKKHSMLFVAATAIIGLSSFEMAKEKLQSVYWFEYDSSGTNLVNQTSAPTPSSTNPFDCEGDLQNCAQAFTSFTMLSPGNYAPGTPAQDSEGDPIIARKNP